ncbi:hypothetical protein ACH4LE_05400 [Streptomyces sp. NPDC017413]|uniref:hypothetical protein n=1 Tax=Streptomyces sp. NPDC017413 TaxID=3364994 RepID=UPI0037B175CA
MSRPGDLYQLLEPAVECIKVWTVRSTRLALFLTFVISTGIGTLVAFNWHGDIAHVVNSSPLAVGLYSVTVGQLALVAFGVLLVGSAYASGSMRVAVNRSGTTGGGSRTPWTRP